MLGAAIVIVAMLLFVPIVLMSGGIMAAILGWGLTTDAEERFEGSELIDLNR